MKLADFEALCRREWAVGYGDVCALTLTAESVAELAEDVLANPGALPSPLILHIRKEETAAVAAGIAIRELRNPLTMTAVTIMTGTGADFVQVRKPVASP